MIGNNAISNKIDNPRPTGKWLLLIQTLIFISEKRRDRGLYFVRWVAELATRGRGFYGIERIR